MLVVVGESGGVGFGVGLGCGVGLGFLLDERMFGCRRRNRWRGSAAWDSASAKAASAAICFNISGDSGTVSASPSRGIPALSPGSKFVTHGWVGEDRLEKVFAVALLETWDGRLG